ncbi:unnamed protein product [Polarella glacialis]|uniref:Uncharacterized protein n=1 Tax=Polarella glacialis TaxID=89957 RepID=A0A813EFW9_POLGL|nr:unnamed protein product [Polarella glacialis]
MWKLAALLVLCLGLVGTATDVEPTALDSDDECVAGEGCALSALQVNSRSSSTEASDDVKKDLTSSQKEAFNMSLSADNVLILELWNNLSVLDVQVNETMQKVGVAAGSPVIWNAKFLLVEENSQASSGRRRGKDFPPRARFVLKQLEYVQTEIDMLWKMLTKISRMDYGIRNAIKSHPDGPPNKAALLDIRSHNSSSQKPLVAKDDYYLYKKYYNMVSEISDAQNKTEELRADVSGTAALAEAWMKR